MIKIGEFAKLFNVSLKTVRFYEEKNPLKPAYIDDFSGYRYYNEDNIETMRNILYLKDLGFSLEEIKSFNNELIQTKIEEYKNTILRLSNNINVLEEKLLVDNDNVMELSEAKEKYFRSLREINNEREGFEMFENEENIYSILNKNDGIVLGKEICLPLDKRGNTNCLVVAGPGAGKSTSYVIPNILRRLGSYVVTDPKGELYDKTHEFMEENGYIVKTINYKDCKDNYGYNPIKHIKNDKDIDLLAETIIENDGPDPFWSDSARVLIKTIIYYILEKAEKKDLLTLFYLLSENKDVLFSKFEEFEENSKGYKFARIVKTFPEKTYASITSTALVKLSFIINKVTDVDDSTELVDFTELYNKKTILYIRFDENFRDEQKMVNILITQILSQLDVDNLDSNASQKVFFLLDGFGMIGRINNLGMYTSCSRRNNISLSFIIQNIKVLEKIYGDELYSVLNNVDTQLLLGTFINSNIEYFADLLMIEPKNIKELDKDKLLIFEKGLKAIEGEKDYYFNH